MSWNYRVVRKTVSKGDDYFALHEAYCTDAGEVESITLEPIAFVGDTREEVIDALRMALKDAERHPVYDDE